MKDTEEQSDEDVQGQGPERVPRAGVSVSVELGCVTLLVCGCVHQPRSSLNPILLRICGSFFTLCDQLLTPFLFQSPSSLWRIGGRAENFKHKIKQILRLVFNDHPAATQSISLNKRYSWCSYHLGNYKGFRSSVPKPRQYIKKQRHYFADKGPSSQSYVFSSSYVWMWELDYKESEHWRIDAFELWC